MDNCLLISTSYGDPEKLLHVVAYCVWYEFVLSNALQYFFRQERINLGLGRDRFTKGRDIALAALFSIFLVSTIFTVLVSNAQLPIITQMNDTTSTVGLSVYSARPVHAEYVTANSTLVGKDVDTIKVTLKKVGNPDGNATIGIFDSALGLQRQFGTVDASKLPSSYREQTFGLGNNESYKIRAGDYIGIKYAGGTASNYVAIMTDQNSTDPFDGMNTYYKYYITSSSSWRSFPTFDITMSLTGHLHNATIPAPITQMSDTTATSGLKLYQIQPIHAEYVSATSALVNKTIDTIEMQLKPAGVPTGTATVGIFRDDINTVMNDSVLSHGMSLYSARKVQAENVTSTSFLAGKKIDRIDLQLRKTGNPTGTAIIGVFNSTSGVKRQFGTIDASSLTTTYQKLSFTLPSGQNYTLVPNDKVGIYYDSGNVTNFIAVMTDQTNSFDGTNSYYVSNTVGNWIKNTAADLTMSIRSIMPLPVALVKQFGTIDASSIPAMYTNETFSLAIGDSYKIRTGDYIGIKYDRGNSSNCLVVMTDLNGSDPFDGTNTFRKFYTNSWNSATTQDLWMILILQNSGPLTIVAPPQILTWSTNDSKTVNLGTPTVVDTDSMHSSWTNSITGTNITNVTISTGTYNVKWTATDPLGNTDVSYQKVALIKTKPVNPYNKQVMINFDDGPKTQWDNAKPILDKYHINATFFIICGRLPINSLNIDYMNYTLVKKLKDAGYDIEGHTYTHMNFNKQSNTSLAFETAGAKACMASYGLPVSTMALPYGEGWNNSTVINAIINAGYNFVRGNIGIPYMPLHCNNFTKPIQIDCRTFADPNDTSTLTDLNRYSILAGDHDFIANDTKLTFPHRNNTKMLENFIAIVNSPTHNTATSIIEIPIIYYHRVPLDNAILPERLKGTEPVLLDAEMKYLRDNGIRTLFFNQLAYNNTSNFLYLTGYGSK